MKIIGEFNRSFGNFLTLRGIASMKDLAKISFANEEYQRELLEEHGDAMKDFLEKGEYTFFPELVFSIALSQDPKIRDKAEKLYDAIPSDSFRKTKFEGFTLKATTKKLQSDADLRAPLNFCRGEFEPIDNDKAILQRIDGNHRLSASEGMNKDIQVPYCIIFYTDQLKAEKFNRVLFNNINFKSVPLTSEENLHLIFEKKEDDEYIFSDEELADPIWFGPEYKQARQLFHKVNLENLGKLKGVLMKGGKHRYTRTLLLDLTRVYKKIITIRKLEEAFQMVNQFLEENKIGTENYQLLTVLVYYHLKNNFSIFSKWIKDNRIYKLNGVDTQGLIKLFDQVLEAKRRTIFLAMPFDDNANENYEAIDDAVKGINTDFNLDLKLELIRIDRKKSGYSFMIIDEILKNIEEGGYLIADISLANPNVYYELGYQMGINRGKNLTQNNFLLVHNNGVNGADFNADKHFNISNISIEKAKDRNDLRRKVEVQLKIYYGLKND